MLSRRTKWKLATLTSFTCAVGVVASTVSAAAPAFASNATTQATTSWLPDVPDWAMLSTPTVARGVVFDQSGKPVTGAHVTLLAWPSNDVLSTLRPGDNVKLVPVAKAATSVDGSYALRLQSITALNEARSKDGLVQFEVVTSGGNSQSVTTFSDAIIGTAASAHLASVGTGPTEGTTAITKAADGAAQHLDVHLHGGLSASAPADGPKGSVATAQVKGCSTYLQQYYTPTWDLIGQTYSTTSGVTSSFSYSSGSTSTLGVGMSTSAGHLGESASGTKSWSSDATQTFPTLSGATSGYYSTEFTYGQYFIICAADTGTTVSWYQDQVAGWAGGTKLQYPSAPSATYCVSELNGSTFTRTSSKAITWTNGVNIAAEIGINLSSVTGYSSSASISFHFTANHHLCGTGGYPASTPYQLEAKA